jgi:hypothetical protein
VKPPPIEPEGALDGLQWSQILRGAVLDNVLTIAAVLPIMLYFAGSEALSEEDGVANRAIEEALISPGFLWWSFIVGLLITVYACFWASRRAGALHLRHGGWTAVMSVVVASIFLLWPSPDAGPSPPVWYDAVGMMLMLPAGLLGGWLAAKLPSPRPDPPGG